MEKHVSSTEKIDLFGSTSSSRAPQPKKDDKVKGSIIVDPTRDFIESLVPTLQQIMKQQTTMLQMM